MPTSHRGHGWTARSRCSAWSDGRGGLPHSHWEGTGSVWSPRGPRERLRQTPSVSGDDAETEGRPRQPALRRVRIRRVWVFSVKAPLGVCCCASSAPISQGGRVGWTSSECRRSGVAGGVAEALPCSGRFLAARSPRPPDRSCHGLCWPSSAGAAERDREVPPAPARHAPVRSEGKYSSRYLPGFLEVVRQRCLLKAFWNVLSACYKIVENYRVSSV